MISIARRIKRLFGFSRPASAVTVTGPATIEGIRSAAEVREIRAARTRIAARVVSTRRREDDDPRPHLYTPIFIPGPSYERFPDPVPAPIEPEPFVGGGGSSGGGGASETVDFGSSSSCDSGMGGGDSCSCGSGE